MDQAGVARHIMVPLELADLAEEVREQKVLMQPSLPPLGLHMAQVVVAARDR